MSSLEELEASGLFHQIPMHFMESLSVHFAWALCEQFLSPGYRPLLFLSLIHFSRSKHCGRQKCHSASQFSPRVQTFNTSLRGSPQQNRFCDL